MNETEDSRCLSLQIQLAESQKRTRELSLANERLIELCKSHSNSAIQQLVLQSCLILKQQKDDNSSQPNIRRNGEYYKKFASIFEEAKEASDKLFMKGMLILGPNHLLNVLR